MSTSSPTPAQRQASGPPASPRPPGARWYILVASALVVVVTAGFGIMISTLFPSQAYELVLGLIIILGASVLTILLFIMSAAFSALHLNDPNQALGLPQGSIRAMIALLLIIVWAIVSVSIFRFVAFGSGTTGPGPAASPDGIKLAQQLFTTMSTLVVAVASFYFGSSTVRNAFTAMQPPRPTLLKLFPTSGEVGQAALAMTIIGKNFLAPPKVVRLVLGTAELYATSITFSNTDVSLIDCEISIDTTQAPGMWDLVVTGDDGGDYRLAKAFKITAKSAAP